MCSNTGPRTAQPDTADEAAERLAAAIEACEAAAASHDGDADASLAAAWAMLAGSDPCLAAKMAQYDDHHE